MTGSYSSRRSTGTVWGQLRESTARVGLGKHTSGQAVARFGERSLGPTLSRERVGMGTSGDGGGAIAESLALPGPVSYNVGITWLVN